MRRQNRRGRRRVPRATVPLARPLASQPVGPPTALFYGNLLTFPRSSSIIIRQAVNRHLLLLEKYSRGRRGAPAKGVGRVTGARVQIPPSPPTKTPRKLGTLPSNLGVFVFCASRRLAYFSVSYCTFCSQIAVKI